MTRIVCGLLAAVAVAGPLRADVLDEKGLPQAAQEIAAVAKAVAKEEGGLKVAVGGFNLIGLDGVSTEGTIQAAVIAALGTDYDPKGALTVTGEYKRREGVVQITAKVARTDGKDLTKAQTEFKEHKVAVAKASDQFRLIPVPHAFPPAGTDPKAKPTGGAEMGKEFAKGGTAFVLNGTLVQAKEGSLYAVEVRTKKELFAAATPLKAAAKGGEASVDDIAIGLLYEIRLLNYGRQEVKADVTVDGLSEFHFTADRLKDGRPAYDGTLVPGGTPDKPGEAVIYGWHDHFDKAKEEHHFQSFLVTEYGKGAVSKLPNAPRGKVGVIGVSFALSFPKGTARSGGETGFGAPGKQKGTVVEVVSDPPHEFVAVRYQRPQK